MCVIVGPVEKVAKTRIVVATTAAPDRQVIVYANEVTLAGQQPVAMILPFYNGRGNGVEVISTAADDSALFDILDRACKPQTRGRGGETMLGYGNSASFDSSPRLEVLRSGSYRYSVAPTAADLHRADERIFRDLPADLQSLVDEYAAGQFGFVVCILDATASYSPFAYVSDVLPNGSLFVPTRHYHTHPTHPATSRRHHHSVAVRPMAAADWAGAAPAHQSNAAAAASVTADWDHDVYVVGLPADGLKCVSMDNKPPTQRGCYRAHRLSHEWDDSSSDLHAIFGGMEDIDPAYIAKYRLTSSQGVHPNVDMVFA